MCLFYLKNHHAREANNFVCLAIKQTKQHTSQSVHVADQLTNESK